LLTRVNGTLLSGEQVGNEPTAVRHHPVFGNNSRLTGGTVIMSSITGGGHAPGHCLNTAAGGGRINAVTVWSGDTGIDVKRLSTAITGTGNWRRLRRNNVRRQSLGQGKPTKRATTVNQRAVATGQPTITNVNNGLQRHKVSGRQSGMSAVRQQPVETG